MNAFMVAGTNSGVGKTTITLALISAIESKGFKIQPFKVGPDFIDTGYHSLASGFPSVNLDSWMLSENYNKTNFSLHCKEKDIAVVEGVMGLYDGFGTTNDSGSSAQIAKILNLPVILIVNGASIARSAAAIVFGFENFDSEVNITGIIFNNVSGESHYNYLKESVAYYCNAEPLGYFKKNDFSPLKSRHLGLVTVEDNSNVKNMLDDYAEILLKRIDIDRLLEKTEYNLTANYNLTEVNFGCSSKLKVSVAKDNAFCFYYHDNLEILKALGAEITFFSPLHNDSIPEDTDILYLGGGYPELYAEQLSSNRSMLHSIKRFSENYGFIYAECGGFIYLTEGVYVNNNKFFSFTGIFKDRAIMLNKLKALGYAEITTTTKDFWGKKGVKAKGHEFHYSYLKNNGNNLKKIYSVTMRKNFQSKTEGYIYKNTLGSYIHLHFGSNIDIIKSLFENFN